MPERVQAARDEARATGGSCPQAGVPEAADWSGRPSHGRVWTVATPGTGYQAGPETPARSQGVSGGGCPQAGVPEAADWSGRPGHGRVWTVATPGTGYLAGPEPPSSIVDAGLAAGLVRARLWVDPALTAEQRVAAALDAGLALGERLATVAPGTSGQVAYAAGWEDGWQAAEHDMAQSWRHLAATVRRWADQPSQAELARRRGEPPAERPAGDRHTPGAATAYAVCPARLTCPQSGSCRDRGTSAASWDHTVRPWNVRTDHPIATLAGYTGNVNQGARSPDDTTLAAGDQAPGGEV